MPALRFSSITKRFPGVVALRDVSFDVQAGSCHAVCGENGAGKSTLGKILAGLQKPDGGQILLEGDVDVAAGHGEDGLRGVTVTELTLAVHRVFDSPRDALKAGVGMVHQELAFCENMTVGENLCLGQLPRRFGFVQRDVVRQRAKDLLATIGATIDPDRPMASLTMA